MIYVFGYGGCADCVESRAHVVVVSRQYSLPKNPVLVVSLSEGLLDQCLGHVLEEIKCHGWIVESFPPREIGGRPAVEREVLEQLTRRGVRVADLAASDQGESFMIDTCAPLGSEVAEIYNVLEGLSPTDATGRATVVVRRGLALLQQGKADFVYLSLPTNLEETSLGCLLEELKNGMIGLDAVIAITATKATGGQHSSGQTVFDVVFDRARKTTETSSVVQP